MATNTEIVKEIIGKTAINYTKDDESIDFHFSDGSAVEFFHIQDCCESVEIDQIDGNLTDLLDSPITMAEIVENENEGEPKDRYDDSFTWTFLKLATIKGYVTVRWYGTSNGYYSESISYDYKT